MNFLKETFKMLNLFRSLQSFVPNRRKNRNNRLQKDTAFKIRIEKRRKLNKIAKGSRKVNRR